MYMLLEKNTTYSQICPDCTHDECGGERNRLKGKAKNFNFSDPLISYKINNYGYRSDDMVKENAESNFLYNGCSNTFGIGVPLESVWAYQLNSFLSGEKFINLAINSGSYKTIIYDVFNYIRNFGKPKGVFLLFPNIERQITFHQYDEETVFNIKVWNNDWENEKFSSVITEETNTFEFYSMVKMLEDYLGELNIPLIWSTWNYKLEKKILSNNIFNNYICSDSFKVYEKVQDLGKPEALDNDYWDVARDNSHLGSKYHLFYALLMHEEWKNKYEKNNK